MKPRGKEWDTLYLWLGCVTKWPRNKWGPQFSQVAKDTCDSGLVTSEVLSEHLVWVSLLWLHPPHLPSEATKAPGQLPIPWTHTLHPFNPASVHSPLTPSVMSQASVVLGVGAVMERQRSCPQGKGHGVTQGHGRESCKYNCPLIHFRAKPKIVQHSVRAWNKADTAL